MDELNRRIAAAMQHYGLCEADIRGRLWLDSGQHVEVILGPKRGGRAQVVEENATAMVDAFGRAKSILS
ncbi:hypothetical protein A1D31_39165 [Bradyrhizobium liaoningense]|nr:hypothetical protein A1D31_39165 [Bradyrhizobium liaoningense]